MATTLSESGSGLDRKALKRPDEFTSATEHFFDGISKHARGLAVLVGVMVALGLGGAFLMSQRQAKSEAAKSALFDAQRSMDTEAKAIATALAPPSKTTDSKTAPKAEEPAVDPSTVAFKKLDVEAKFPEALKKLKAVASNYDGTRSAYDARLKLGDLYFNHGEAAKSVSWYHQAVESAPGTFEKALAYSAEGYAQEDSGHPADAYASFEKALNLGEGSIKGDVMMAMARCQEALHDTAKARSIYDQILQQLPNTDYAKSAEVAKAALH